MDRMNNYTKAKLIIWLRDTISAEVEKPENEINIELVDACSKLLSELMGDHIKFTKEELYERLAKIMATKPETEAKRKPRFKLKQIVAFACAAAVLACATFAVGAFNPSVRNMVLSVLKLGDGDSFDETGITYVNMGKTQKYTSITELITAENFDIMYPHILPDGVDIKEVLYKDIEDGIVFKFSKSTLYMEVFRKEDRGIKTIIKNSDSIRFNNIDYYIIKKNEMVSAYTIVGDYTYSIFSESEKDIETILSGLYGD